MEVEVDGSKVIVNKLKDKIGEQENKILKIKESEKEEKVKNKDLKKAFDDKCKELNKIKREIDSLKVSPAEKDSELINVKEKHVLEIEKIVSCYKSNKEKILNEKEQNDFLNDKKIQKLIKRKNVLRVSLTETEFHMKESNEKHFAEKEKIKENFNKNKENFLKQKENNDNLRVEVEELLITIEEKNSEIEVFKQEVKSKEDNINDLKKTNKKIYKNV